MNYVLRNNITLIGNITKVGDVFETKTGKKMKFFDLGQGYKYKNEQGEEITNSQYFTVRLNEDLVDKYDFIKVGNPIHVTGYLKSYINKNKIREIIVVPQTIKDLTKETEHVELFDYDWLNDDSNEETQENEL